MPGKRAARPSSSWNGPSGRTFVESIDVRFSGNQLVGDHSILDDNQAFEAPAGDMSVLLEIEDIQKKISFALAFSHVQIQFVSLATIL